MKILVVSHSAGVPAFQEKLKWLAKKPGVSITLLVPYFWPLVGKRICALGMRSKYFKIISAPIVGEGKTGWYFHPYFWSYFRKAKPDIVHIEEEPFSMSAWQAAWHARRRHSKIVFFTWENLQQKFRWPQSQARKFVLAHTDHAICGNGQAARMLQADGLAKDKISIFPQYGVDPGLFRKKNVAGLKKDMGLSGLTIGYIGRLVKAKGVLDLVRAAAKMKVKANLMLVGEGPLKEEIVRETARLGMQNRLFLVDPVYNEQVPDFINCLDILVLPSRTTAGWKEQFGRVLIEAMSCEVPVIGSSSGAIPEVIGKAGLVFPEGNVTALTKCLNSLAGSASLRKKLGWLGKKRVLSLYTDQKLAEKIYKIYKTIL